MLQSNIEPIFLSFLVSLRFVCEWKNSIQFCQWVGWVGWQSWLENYTWHCAAQGFGLPLVAKLPPVPPSLPCNWGLLGGYLNYAAPQEHRVWQSCNWLAPMIGSKKPNYWNLFCRFTSISGDLKVQEFYDDDDCGINLSQISNCPVGATRPSIPTLVWDPACWSVIDQFPLPTKPT